MPINFWQLWLNHFFLGISFFTGRIGSFMIYKEVSVLTSCLYPSGIGLCAASKGIFAEVPCSVYKPQNNMSTLSSKLTNGQESN